MLLWIRIGTRISFSLDLLLHKSIVENLFGLHFLWIIETENVIVSIMIIWLFEHTSKTKVYQIQHSVFSTSIRCHMNTIPTRVVFTLFPEEQLHPFLSGRTLHSSPSRHGCIWHHHFCSTIEATAEKEI